MQLLKAGAALGASYRLVEQIGAGAVGEVWLVESSVKDGLFAAKIMKAEHAKDPALVERFVRERSVLLGLRHTNVVTVRDLVVEGETLAIVMDYVPGGSVRDLLNEAGPLPATEALMLCAQVFSALAEAHAQDVTHRDVKPDNVLLTASWDGLQQGTVRVTDFGIASITEGRERKNTELLGTPQYMAPELISRGQTSSAADVYSTGIVLYELLCGRTPFAGPGTDFTVAYRHVHCEVPELPLPEPIWAVVRRLLDKDPAARPSATEAATTLARLATECADLPALEPSEDDFEFQQMSHPATMLRSDLLRNADADDHEPPDETSYASALPTEVPDLGDGGGHTVLRSLPELARRPGMPAQPTVAEPSKSFTKKNILWAVAGVILLAGVGIGALFLFGGGDAPSRVAEAATEPLTATQQDPPLPTGLAVARAAEYDPELKQVSLTITYSAQKAPLSGAFLEVLPGPEPDAECPAAVWDGVQATRHRSSTTSLRADCGWTLEGVKIPADGQVVFTAAVPMLVADISELNDWLSRASQQTAAALGDTRATSTAYPVQRLRDVQVDVPSRAVSQTPLAVTLVPVWPSGADNLNPLYQSPSVGTSSQMLQDVAGGEDGVRFSDGCSGAVAISADGLVVTALSTTSECRLYAYVGNFANLPSSPFSITTRD